MRLHFSEIATGLLGAGLCLTVHAAAGPATIPFSLHGDNIVVMAQLDGSKPLPFIFDSGLSHGGIVTTQSASALGLKATRKLSVGGAGGGPGHAAKLTTVHALKIGSAKLKNPPFAIINVPAKVVARKGKPPIAGFIGAPMLKHAVVCISYTHKRLERWPRKAFDPKGYVKIPAQRNHGLVTIQAAVDGRQATFAVDTGNNGGVELFPAFVRAHHLLKQYPNLHPMEGMGGGGRHFHILAGTAKTLRFAPQVVLDKASMLFVAQSFNPAWGIDGLLGYQVLSRLNPCIDRKGGAVYLPASAQGRSE